MNIEFKRVTKKLPEYKQIKQLYFSAFPSEERAPFYLMIKRTKRENVDFLAIYCEKKWVGMIYIINYLDLSYVFYFALDDSQRGQGIALPCSERFINFTVAEDFFLHLNSLTKMRKIMLNALAEADFI